MEVEETGLDVVVRPKIFADAGGYFFESYDESRFRKYGIASRFVQDKQSRSRYGAVRGRHRWRESLENARR